MFTSKMFTGAAMIVAVLLISAGLAVAAPGSQGQPDHSTPGKAGKSLGKVTLDTTVYGDESGTMLYGSGIPNGQWVTAEVQGVVVGLRATDRTDGLLGIDGTSGDRVGVYHASTGFDGSTTNRSEWNYEWSVDLRHAKGNAAGKTLADYHLVLEQDYTEESLYGALGSDPVNLPMPDTCEDVGTDQICQQSWNPMFGNGDFDPNEERSYHLRLVLTPETFSGPPLAVAIQVEVTEG